MLSFYIMVVFTAASFACYATSALVTKRMVIEFERYGYADKRVFIAISQLSGALGLLAGLVLPAIGILAAAGLSAQMAWALVVRRRIGDPFLQSLPAVAYLAISTTLVATYAVKAIN